MRLLHMLCLAGSLGVSLFGCGSSGSGPRVTLIGCDPLVPSYCGFPFPNDAWVADDDTTATGIRLALPQAIMPADQSSRRSNVEAFNEADGFSPGIAAMAHMPGATTTGLATPNSIEASLEDDSPTVILNAETGERVPHWAELDEYVLVARQRNDADESRPTFTVPRTLEEIAEQQALMVRPAIRLDDATRYIVAIRSVVDENGAALVPSPAFEALRDGRASNEDDVEARRDHFKRIFRELEDAGVAVDDLQLAWDFTTASRENNTRWMLHIRDDALAAFPDGVPYTVERLQGPAIDDDIEETTACVLEFVFDVPLYTTGGEAGSSLNFGADGMPEQNGTFGYNATMVVPKAAQEASAPLVAFGHGQLGTRGQVLGFQPIADALNLIGFGLDFKGFAADDQIPIVTVLGSGDLSGFRIVPERMHQGYLNFLMAMRTLSREANGGPTTTFNQALTNDCGGAQVNGDKRYYFGGSQGGILGASLMAIWTDVVRGVLAVPGQSYNLLLNRSVNFDLFAPFIYPNYNWNGLHMQLNLALMQGLWDRAEPTGYSKYIRTDNLPGTPAHEVLIQVSKSDHQVTNLGAHIMARTIGGVVNLAPTIRTVWGIEEVTGEHTGSAMVEVDFGNPEAPIGNIPPWGDTMPDPHGRATQVMPLAPMLSQFYETGSVENLCDGACDLNDL